jgi:hypothetical protein
MGSIVEGVSLLIEAVCVMCVASMLGISMMNWCNSVGMVSISSVVGSMSVESVLLSLVVVVSNVVRIVAMVVWSNSALVKSMVVIVLLGNIISVMSIGAVVDWCNSIGMVGVA